jgi:hypothetical protein
MEEGDMASPLTRRQFIKKLGVLAATPALGKWLSTAGGPGLPAAQTFDVYVSRNGTPVSNVGRAVAQAGGIQRFVDYGDAVVLKPNGQWPNQGYTHTQCLKALIDVILDRAGGFGGEIILAEHIHRDPSEAMGTDYCWNMSADNRLNNWPDMNYLELVADYLSRGILNVTACPLYESDQANWHKVSGPAEVGSGEQGWVHVLYAVAKNGRMVDLSYPIIRSSYSGKLIDLKKGVWQSGGYTGQKVKVIFLPTLNNHGYGVDDEDYAGPTSAMKCHIGVVDFNNLDGDSLHDIGYGGTVDPQAMGEAVGQLVTQVIKPSFYLTCAEYTGYISRTDATAAHTKTVGLCTDPVTLDYWMCKHVLYPCASQAFMNPDNPSNLRRALVGCHSKGVGTITESQIALHLSDMSQDRNIYLPMLNK